MQTRYSQELIPITGWNREETFRFFSTFSQPYFNVHTELDITPLYTYCKANKLAVSLGYMHATLQAARATENFCYRIQNGEVVKYNGLDLSSTVLKDDLNVGFTHFPYHENLEDFCCQGAEIIAEVKKSTKLFNGYQGVDLLHMTTLPWFKFKGMEHAFALNGEEAGVPKLGFGQLEMKEDKVILPLSIGLHHALADGYHMHLFMQNLEAVVATYKS